MVTHRARAKCDDRTKNRGGLTGCDPVRLVPGRPRRLHPDAGQRMAESPVALLGPLLGGYIPAGPARRRRRRCRSRLGTPPARLCTDSSHSSGRSSNKSASASRPRPSATCSTLPVAVQSATVVTYSRRRWNEVSSTPRFGAWEQGHRVTPFQPALHATSSSSVPAPRSGGAWTVCLHLPSLGPGRNSRRACRNPPDRARSGCHRRGKWHADS
jgi:hypothetical protein